MKQNPLFILLLTILFTGSCAPPPPVFTSPDADFAFYEHVGIIPFSNLTNDRNAAEKVTSSFTTELLMQDVVEIVNSGDFFKSVRATIQGERTNYPEELTSEEAMTLGKNAKVEGILVGAVHDYAMIRVGSDEFPLVGITLRFYDCQSGKIVWSYEITRRGGPKFPIFSFGETHTLGDMTTKVCRAAAEAFARARR